MKKKKIYLSAGIGVILICAVGAGVFAYQSSNKTEGEVAYKETTVEKGTLTVGITESGSVTIGTIEQEFELESSASTSTQTGSNGSGQTSGTASGSSSSNTLEVEEVYVSAGQKVNEGDPLLKLTEESVSKYKASLEKAVSEAQIAVNEAALNAGKQKLEAGYSYNLSIAEGSVAEETYQAALKELQEAVEDAQEDVDASAALINYYQEQIDEGVDLYESLEEEQKNYSKLYTKLQSAQNAYTTKSIEAEETYQKAILSSQNAGSQYSVDMSGADSDVEEAEETLTEAEEALDEFNACIGEDGIIYAEYTGTIMEVAYSSGDTLSASSSIVTFADTEAVTMTVSVSQEDISEITVGDVVNIELTAYEDKVFLGEVVGMDTATSSGSSTVSYDVTVSFTGDITGVYMDMTGNVTFIQKQVEDVLYISNKAVISEGTIFYAKVKDSDGTIQKVEVETGFSDGVNVEITSGLSEGDTVLIESQVSAT